MNIKHKIEEAVKTFTNAALIEVLFEMKDDAITAEKFVHACVLQETIDRLKVQQHLVDDGR